MITEIGAVKVRGGEVLGEFQTLVNPHAAIPPVHRGAHRHHQLDGRLLPADRVGAAGVPRVRPGLRPGGPQRPVRRRLPPALRRRSRVGPGPRFEVLDTARLARRVVTRDDAPNCKLSSLAVAFGSTTTPNHRALSDARATVDVLHGLMERLGGLGVHTLEELQTFSSRVSPAVRRKRHLAEHLPHSPGVYLFRDEQRAGPLRRHLAATSAPACAPTSPPRRRRSRMGEMVNLAASVTGIECATPLEARVRELRLIAAHKPRYNRRSRHPEKMHWLKLTVEPWPRLSLVRKVAEDGADYLGPFASRRTAEKCLAALHETFPIRQCSDRLPITPTARRASSPRWGAASRPATAASSIDDYAALVAEVRDSLLRQADEVVEALTAPDGRLADDERFEEAGVHRDRLSAFVRAASRTQRLGSLSSCAELVAARREDDRRWAVHVVRHGRLAAVGRDPARRPRRRLGDPAARVRRDGGPAAPARRRRPAPRSPSRSCAGSSSPACGWSTSRASGPARSAAPPATSRSTTPSSSPAPRWCPSTSAAAGDGPPAR